MPFVRYLPMTLKFNLCRVPTAQGKQGKWPQKTPGNLDILPENTGNLVNSINRLLYSERQAIALLAASFADENELT